MSTSGLVPIIDFGPFISGSQAEKEGTARELLDAMKTVGFVMLKNFYGSSVTKEKVVNAFAQVRCAALVLSRR